MAREERMARWIAAVVFWTTEAALWVAAAPFYALGWLAGVFVFVVLFVWAALVAGYKAGYRIEG
jgi:hypothetical protein